MKARFLEWIWHIKGSVALAPGQSSAQAFDRLTPLFLQVGTSYDRNDDTLTFSKKDAVAQDKMSIFDNGVLQIEQGADGAMLQYRLVSRALLFCFLAPLMFLAFAQLTVAVNKFEKASTHEAAKKPEKKEVALQQNPIDKALGSPAPEKPKKDKDKEDKLSPTASYIFAGLFAALYIFGRIWEARLIKRLFTKSLLASSPA